MARYAEPPPAPAGCRGMDAILGFVFGIGGLVVLAAAAASAAGWYIIATRAKKLKETT